MKDSFVFKEVDEEGLETLVAISKADAFNKWMYDTIAPYLHGNILEIGSGIGNISKYFVEEGKTITVSDIRENYCKHLSSYFGHRVKDVVRLDLVHDDFSNIYKDHLQQYDSLFALNVVEHIENDKLALANAKMLLKPGGTMLILVPAFPQLYNSLDRELYHFRRYKKNVLVSKMQEAGLKITSSFYFNTLGMAGWMVSGWMNKKLISGNQMATFNAIVPIAKAGDAIFKRTMGLSVVVVGKVPA